MSKLIDYSNMSIPARVGVAILECFSAGAFITIGIHSIIRASMAMIGGNITIETKKKV